MFCAASFVGKIPNRKAAGANIARQVGTAATAIQRCAWEFEAFADVANVMVAVRKHSSSAATIHLVNLIWSDAPEAGIAIDSDCAYLRITGDALGERGMLPNGRR